MTKQETAKLRPHLCIVARPQAKQEMILCCGDTRVTVLTERLFRIERGSFTDEATQAVWYRDFPRVEYTWHCENGRIVLKTAALTLTVDPECPENSEVEFADGSRARLDNAENLRGTCSTLDTNGEHLREHPEVNRYDRAHIPLEPGVCARNGAAVYDDSGSLLLLADGRLLPHSGTDLYVFAYGQDYPAAVRALYRLCGRTPVLPRWALGNWWCRYWPYTQQEYQNLMDNFADDRIPISVAVIDMDWHYVHIARDFALHEQGLDDAVHGGTDGWTGYTWNEALFPDHAALLRDLHTRGMHVSLNLHPALGVRWYEKPYRAMAERMGLDPAEKRVVPFQIAEARFVNAYLELLHHPLEDEGVDFWWIDWQQGKTSALAGLDPLWALNHYHYLDSVQRRGEGLILSRYAGVGSHRYPVGFSGDTHMDWEFLDYMPYFTATAANVGYGWWSHDIGGHHRGLRDEELYLRWLQFGVFSPINRLHCCPSVVTSKEPWTYSAPVRAMAEKWLRLRRRLVPYLYSASWKNTLEGVVPVRPMYYEWPEKAEAYEADHQFLFGELLAAPITEKSRAHGIAGKRVWLPPGRWTDLFTGTIYRGGRWVTVWRDSGTMPVFARAGCILPLDTAQDNACAAPETLEIFAYPGNGSYELIEEHGMRTGFWMQSTPGTLRLRIKSARKLTYRIHFKSIADGVCSLSIAGKAAQPVLRCNRCLQAIVALEAGQEAELLVTWQEKSDAEIVREQMLQCFLRLELENSYKEAQWETAKNIADGAEWVRWIEALALDDVEKGLLKEQSELLWER